MHETYLRLHRLVSALCCTLQHTTGGEQAEEHMELLELVVGAGLILALGWLLIQALRAFVSMCLQAAQLVGALIMVFFLMRVLAELMRYNM